MRAGVDDGEQIPRRLAEHRAIDLHLEVGLFADDVNGEPRHTPGEEREVLVRDLLAILAAVLHRLARGGLHLEIRGAEAALLLVTDGEVQERAAAGVEPLALGELRASLGVSPTVHQLAPFLEERLGEHLVGDRRCGLGGPGEDGPRSRRTSIGSGERDAGACHRGQDARSAHV